MRAYYSKIFNTIVQGFFKEQIKVGKKETRYLFLSTYFFVFIFVR